MKLLVDIQGGHKTGYYLDQRDSRLATRQYVADKRVLNCFSYTGGFAVSALMGGCARWSAWIPRRKRWTWQNRTSS
jgi:23S rRNA (cytosine1962-C5)-methyltransferase